MQRSRHIVPRPHRHANPRRGAVLLLVCLMLIVLIAFTAFAVDTGRMTMLRAEIQNSVDAGTLAAQLQFAMDPGNTAEARKAAEYYVRENQVGSSAVDKDAITVEVGHWDGETKSFTVGDDGANAVRVSARSNDEQLSFGPALGHRMFGAPAEAIASSNTSSMDIVMTLDLSGSMLYQGRIEALRESAPVFIEAIDELGSEDQIAVMGLSADPSDFDPADFEDGVELYDSGLHATSGHHVGVLEMRLTDDLPGLKSTLLTADRLRSSKYQGWTGTGAALGDSVHYLTYGYETREKAQKIIVLMSDGHANKPDGNGPGYARQMANYAAENDVTVYTISLGNSADEDLMQDIADATGGKHFLANGKGADVLTAALSAAFKEIAGEVKKTRLVR